MDVFTWTALIVALVVLLTLGGIWNYYVGIDWKRKADRLAAGLRALSPEERGRIEAIMDAYDREHR
jgi:hypothetical protein